MRKIILVGILSLLLAAGLIPLAAAQDAMTPAEHCDAALPAETPANRDHKGGPEQVLQPNINYQAIFCTGAGAVYVDLYEDYAPITVNSFVFLAQDGFYNNTNFHRVIADFMVQGGDPSNTGMGGPNYRFEDEFVGFLHFDVPGLLAMANSGPGTNGSQFFITTVPTPHLNFKHTIFGAVLEGQSNVEGIELRDPGAASGPGTALQTVLIITDPATVKSNYSPPPLATASEVEAAFAKIGPGVNQMADFLKANPANPETLSSDAAVDAAPDSVKGDYAGFLEKYNHEYQIGTAIVYDLCELETFPIPEMRYTLDAFATPEDAAAALEDGFLDDLKIAGGLSDEGDGLFTGTTTACNTEVTHASMTWQRGRFLATVEVKYVANPNIMPARDLLTTLVGPQLFEFFLSDVLRPEIR